MNQALLSEGLFCFLALCCPAQEHVQKRLFLQEVRVLPATGKRQDRRQIAAQHDRQFLAFGNQLDAADECAQPLGRLRPRFLVVKLVVESADLFVIDPGDVGMQKGRRFFRRLQHGRNIFLALFQRHHPGVDAVGRPALEDQIEKRVEFAIDLLYLCLGRFDGHARSYPGLVRFPCKLLAEVLEQFRLHQMLVEAIEHRGFERVAPDVDPVVACALVARVGAAKQVFRDHRIAATAAAAFDKAGEEMLRPASVAHEVRGSVRGRIVCEFLLPFSHGVPDVLIHNAQFRNILNDPFAFRVRARYTLARIRVFDIAQPVPDQLADVKLIVQDAGSALRVAVNGGRSPFAALRPWHALAV